MASAAATPAALRRTPRKTRQRTKKQANVASNFCFLILVVVVCLGGVLSLFPAIKAAHALGRGCMVVCEVSCTFTLALVF